jgi:uncharacterized membrane protein
VPFSAVLTAPLAAPQAQVQATPAEADTTELVADQDKSSSPPRKKSRRGAGAHVLGSIFKAFAILIWVFSLAILTILGSDILGRNSSADLSDLLQAFAGDSTTPTILVGFIVGLVFFGIGEAISLLNDIRRNTWR